MAKKLETTINVTTEKKEISQSRFCVELACLWMQYCPELRFMQFISNFQAWMGQDGFYLRDTDTLQKIEEFCKAIKAKTF